MRVELVARLHNGSLGYGRRMSKELGVVVKAQDIILRLI
jgi:hypothetical protein